MVAAMELVGLVAVIVGTSGSFKAAAIRLAASTAESTAVFAGLFARSSTTDSGRFSSPKDFASPKDFSSTKDFASTKGFASPKDFASTKGFSSTKDFSSSTRFTAGFPSSDTASTT
ncbi:Heavy neurofilament NF-H [Paramicrosporidium saccamoebae]|uniref:Heavy neurofilament NF-H n=1 Tax=Paramicrosporidium saccamoebae TaxID=1246581 RepID=A0A2H9TJ53_9FUNG|nr:Heavy neurofilament NF-H [Paramicrosporidium saccamoebae]